MGNASQPTSLAGAVPIIGQTLVGVTPGTIIGQVLYWDGMNWVPLDPGFAGQQLTTQGAGSAPIWSAGEGVLGEYFIPELANLTDANGLASANTVARNNRLFVNFDDATDQNCTFAAVMSDAYAGGSLRAEIDWVAESAVIGDVGWGAAWERLEPNGPNVDLDQFAAARFTTDTTNATNGLITRTSIDFTSAQADGIAPGDSFRFQLLRDTSVANNMGGDAQMMRVAIREI